MNTCRLVDFIKTLEPWLSEEHIEEGFMDEDGVIHFTFKNGAVNTYRIDDCNADQLKDVIDRIKDKGIPFKG